MRMILALLGLSFLMMASSAAAEPADEARAVVMKAIEAHGGAARLTKYKTQMWKVKGKMTVFGQSMVYTGDFTFGVPDMFRFDLQIDMGGQKIMLTAATDGKVAWEQVAPMLRDMTPEKAAEFHHNVYVMRLLLLSPLLDKEFTLTPLGESKHGEQTLVGIKVTRAGHKDVNLYFDKKTGLTTKTNTRVNDEFQNNKEVTQETLITGYRDKDGGKVFDRLTITRDGKEFLVEDYSDHRGVERTDPKLFVKPPAGEQ